MPPDGRPASSHSDGICLNSSVWLDEKKIMDEGEVIDEELGELVRKAKNYHDSLICI